MCGIFGVIDKSGLQPARAHAMLRKLFVLSASRGKEAAGLALLPRDPASTATVLKADVAPERFIKGREFRRALTDTPAVAWIGHSRLVTNGSQSKAANNQPVVRGDLIGVHNGIIVNDRELLARNPDLNCEGELDSEVLFALLQRQLTDGLLPALSRTFEQLSGSASVAVIDARRRAVALATNTGSLYLCERDHALVFASEESILTQLGGRDVRRLEPGQAMAINLSPWRTEFAALPAPRHDRAPDSDAATPLSRVSPEVLVRSVPQRFERATAEIEESVRALRRCTRCVLPETTPYLRFDRDGVCQLCRAHVPLQMKGRPALEQEIARRKDKGRFDCLLAFSGGRDSSYGLHYVVKELGLKPVTYTYDWGLVTDLARRNVSRMCSSLGVENIVISADIATKRENVRMNVEAWLKAPHLGMVPLFMAGDKQFFWYAQVVKRKLGMRFDIFTMNLLENAMFKDDFTGQQIWDDTGDAARIGNSLALQKSLGMAAFYGRQFLGNRGYLNSSLVDTFAAYLSYYFLPRDYLVLYEYVPWNERAIERVLLGQYGWETSPDTESTWRIGDGTTPFYNFIYHCVAGLTENDTLRSNQVREGELTREQALAFIERDNRPRWPSLQWYCSVVGLDFERTIARILELPRHYQRPPQAAPRASA